MRKLRLSVCVLGLLVAFGGMAQNNMVANGSFELTEKKVKNGEGELILAFPWFSPNETGTADLYEKGNKKGYGIPENDRGYMDVDDGIRYAGFRAFSYRNKLPRTYLQAKLEKPLIAGKKYCVTFNLALSKTSKYASNNIAMNISVKKPKESDFTNFVLTPHIRNERNKIYEDQFGWETVCGVYVASGDERYIAIGNFTSDDDMADKRDYIKNKKLKEFPQLQAEEAYYYIDEVTLINLEELDMCDCGETDAGGNQMKVVYNTSSSDDMDMDVEDVVALKTIYFEKNQITPNSASEIREIIDIMKSNSDIDIEIIGHMDKIEDKDNLDDLSEKRAKEVYDYMVKNGIPEGRLSYKGMKSTEPADTSGTQASLAKNRRVSFEVK